MIIERVEIRNFRSLLKVDLNFEELTAILGRNGGGKSSILKALDVFYNVSYQASPFDYFGKDTNLEIRITVTYADLHADELKEFDAYLSNGNLSVSKIITSGGSKYFGSSKQIPEFNEVRKLSAVPKRTRINELVKAATFAGFNQTVTSGEQADQIMAEYEAAHPELTQSFEKEQQFFGPRNVGGGKLDKFTKFVLIPAVRDAASETDKKGTIHQLIDVLVARNVNSRPDVIQLNNDFEQRVKDIYNHNNLTELSALATAVTKLLSQYAPGAGLNLDFEDIIPPKISLPAALASLVEDNFKTPISYSGHGVQRALVLALLQQLSITDLSPQSPTKDTDTAAQATLHTEETYRLPDLILAIEEPELYLHPSRSRYLASVLKRLSIKPTETTTPRTQIIYATHSPFFIDLDQFDRIRIARKIPVPDVTTLQCSVTSYTKSEAAKRLANVSGKNPNDFSTTSFIAHTVPVMNTIVNEGFFADVAVVVEGLSDVGALWAIQEIKGKNWDAEGITIVPANGKNNIDRPVVVFEGFSIPTYFIFDGDSNHLGNKDKEKGTAAKNRACLSLAGGQPVDFPKTQVNENYAVFSESLENELELAVGTDEFHKIRQEVATTIGYQEPSKALKNLEGAAMFIKLTYERGLTIPVLEEIVTKITALKY